MICKEVQYSSTTSHLYHMRSLSPYNSSSPYVYTCMTISRSRILRKREAPVTFLTLRVYCMCPRNA